MNRTSAYKSNRLLQIYSALIHGKTLRKKELAQQFNVTERSIQRDMEALRCFLEEQHFRQIIVYDKYARGYRLESDCPNCLSNDEIMVVCKILLESRSLRMDEMLPLLNRLVTRCVPEKNKKNVNDLIANEWHYYIPPRHDTPLLHSLWEIGQAVEQKRVIKIEYRKQNDETICCAIEPVELHFSEFYFYLIGFLRNGDSGEKISNADGLCPNVYRVDRISRVTVTDDHFIPAYAPQFREEEFRKRVQFMCGGTLSHIQFRYTGPVIETVLDRLPTAKIVSQDDEGWTIDVEVFGNGIDMWLRSQGDYVSQIQRL